MNASRDTRNTTLIFITSNVLTGTMLQIKIVELVTQLDGYKNARAIGLYSLYIYKGHNSLVRLVRLPPFFVCDKMFQNTF